MVSAKSWPSLGVAHSVLHPCASLGYVKNSRCHAVSDTDPSENLLP